MRRSTRSALGRFGPRLRRWSVGAVLLLVIPVGVQAGVAGPAAAAASSHADSVRARQGAGDRVTAEVLDAPPRRTAAELEQLNRLLDREGTGPKGATASVPDQEPLGPGLAVPKKTDEARPLAATVLRDSTIPASAVAGGASYVSSTQEPSTDANGPNIFQVGNWYASRSLDSGATWTYLNPFTLFGSGFCCDQVTQYDAATGQQFWLLQYDDHLTIANAPASGSGAFTNWCSYEITPSWLGLADDNSLDYNDLTITNGNVNISTNVYPPGGTSAIATGLLRLPKEAMSACAPISYNYLTRTDDFTFKLTPGSTDTLYWGSNWGQSNGASFRVFAWPENSDTYAWWDRAVAPYVFMYRDDGQNCASSDGVVTNWCQFADSRVLGAYRAGGALGFSFNAKQDAGHPFPYTRIVWFNESDKAYVGSGDQWADWGGIQYMSLASNSLGQVGSEFAWGGGTGGTHYYPGSAVNSSGPTTIAIDPNYYLWGEGNTCLSGGIPRWGDYLTVRTYQTDPTTWIAGGYAIKGGNCGATGAYSEPHNVLFSG
ncbi:hypothetical protein [Streptomyces sp. NPDC005336]|uniref:hypothetical protein n=1 Tax=Streptomyces sp. NPDC005336 TaxID=3157035 RepID=UPI0033B1BEB2